MECDVRLARESDAEAISEVILSALRKTNAKDYSPDIIARVEQSFTPAAVRTLLGSRTVLVATQGEIVVGTASLDGSVVRSIRISHSTGAGGRNPTRDRNRAYGAHRWRHGSNRAVVYHRATVLREAWFQSFDG